jgi:hypothetical protein
MSSLRTQVSAIVSVLQRFNKIKPDLVTAKRVEKNCRNIKDTFSFLLGETLISHARATRAVGACADAGLLKLLVPFLVRLLGCGIADEETISFDQLGLQLWEGATGLLFSVMTLANKWHAKSPTLSKSLARAVLPDSPFFPGEQQVLRGCAAHY